jgi:hypothetical protein
MIFSGLEAGLIFHTHFYKREIVKKHLTFVSRIGTEESSTYALSHGGPEWDRTVALSDANRTLYHADRF